MLIESYKIKNYGKYPNPTTYIAHSLHGQFFGTHDFICSLKANKSGGFFNISGSMDHIRGPKIADTIYAVFI